MRSTSRAPKQYCEHLQAHNNQKTPADEDYEIWSKGPEQWLNEACGENILSTSYQVI